MTPHRSAVPSFHCDMMRESSLTVGVDVQTIIEFRYVFVRAEARVTGSPSPDSSTYLSTSSNSTKAQGCEHRSDADFAEPSIRLTPDAKAMFTAELDLSADCCRSVSSSRWHTSIRNGLTRFFANFWALFALSRITRMFSR